MSRALDIAKVAARRRRIDALHERFPHGRFFSTLNGAETAGGDLFALVEENVAGGSPGGYITRWPSPEEAMDYHYDQEGGDAWRVVGVWDLDTGDRVGVERTYRTSVAAAGDLDRPAPDPRLCCKFHPTVPATRVAPQHDGGDEDVPAVWVPVCEEHVADWYEDHEDDRLPMFDLTAAS